MQSLIDQSARGTRLKTDQGASHAVFHSPLAGFIYQIEKCNGYFQTQSQKGPGIFFKIFIAIKWWLVNRRSEGYSLLCLINFPYQAQLSTYCSALETIRISFGRLIWVIKKKEKRLNNIQGLIRLKYLVVAEKSSKLPKTTVWTWPLMPRLVRALKTSSNSFICEKTDVRVN